jgi:hypothetical protein
MIQAQLLYAAPKGGNTSLLGLVIDEQDVASLQAEGGMPGGGYLKACTAVLGDDGAFYALGVVGLVGAVPVYTVAAATVKEQVRAAGLAKLSAEEKEALGLAAAVKP